MSAVATTKPAAGTSRNHSSDSPASLTTPATIARNPTGTASMTSGRKSPCRTTFATQASSYHKEALAQALEPKTESDQTRDQLRQMAFANAPIVRALQISTFRSETSQAARSPRSAKPAAKPGKPVPTTSTVQPVQLSSARVHYCLHWATDDLNQGDRACALGSAYWLS